MILREVEMGTTSCKARRQKASKNAKMPVQVGETRPDRFRKKASTDGGNKKINGHEISAKRPGTQGGNTKATRSPRWQGQVTPPLFTSVQLDVCPRNPPGGKGDALCRVRGGGGGHIPHIPPQAVQTQLSRRSPAKSGSPCLVSSPASAGRWRFVANSSARIPPTRPVTATQPAAMGILRREGGGHWFRPGYTPFRSGYVRAPGDLFSLVKTKNKYSISKSYASKNICIFQKNTFFQIINICGTLS